MWISRGCVVTISMAIHTLSMRGCVDRRIKRVSRCEYQEGVLMSVSRGCVTISMAIHTLSMSLRDATSQ